MSCRSAAVILALIPAAGLALAAPAPERPAVRILAGHADTVYAIAFSPDGRTLAVAARRDGARLWDPRTGKDLGTLRRDGGDEYFSIAFSPDGRTLAVGDLGVTLWDVTRHAPSAHLTGFEGLVNSVSFPPDGKSLAGASRDGTARVWELKTGKERLRLQGRAPGDAPDVYSVAFAPAGAVLATASFDGTVKIWDAATGARLATFRGHKGLARGMAFSPDGKQVASCGGVKAGEVILWDRTGKALHRLNGHEGFVLSVAFSPDGKLLASAGSDGTVRLWDAATGRGWAVLRGHRGFVRAVAFSPDGRQLASGGDDRDIRLWDVRAAAGPPR